MQSTRTILARRQSVLISLSLNHPLPFSTFLYYFDLFLQPQNAILRNFLSNSRKYSTKQNFLQLPEY